MSDVTRIMSQVEAGDPSAAEQLLPLVYDELRKLAASQLSREKPGQTLQATALVHEAYLRLVDLESAQKMWNGRRHFFAAAAQAMRRILVDRARQKLSLKGGGAMERQFVDANDLVGTATPTEVLAVHDCLDALVAEDSSAAEIVKLRYFAGLSLEEAAEILGISRATAYRLWTYARASLHVFLQDRPGEK